MERKPLLSDVIASRLTDIRDRSVVRALAAYKAGDVDDLIRWIDDVETIAREAREIAIRDRDHPVVWPR